MTKNGSLVRFICIHTHKSYHYIYRLAPLLFENVGLAFFSSQFVSAGVFDVLLYWGEWKFGWGVNQEAVALYISIGAGVIGAVLAPRILVRPFHPNIIALR